MNRRYSDFDESRERSGYDDRPSWRERTHDRWDYDTYDRERDFPPQGPRGPNYRQPNYGPEYVQGYSGYQPAYGDHSRPGESSHHDAWTYEHGPLRSHLRCRDIMTRGLVTCHRDTPIRRIAQIMREEDTGAVPVVSDDTTLEGIVTDRDIVVRGLTSNKGDTEFDANDCMSTDIYSAHPNDRLVDVLEEMGDHQVRRIPIVDNRNRLVGIVSMADIAVEAGRDRELAQALEKISKPASWFDRVSNFFRW